MKDTAAVFEAMPNSSCASTGRIERSRPTMPPTKAFVATSSANWRQFGPSPSRTSTVGGGVRRITREASEGMGTVRMLS
jgi:hypothetical protein